MITRFAISLLLIAGLAMPCIAQTAPPASQPAAAGSTPSSGATPGGARRGGSGVGVGVQIDLGKLLGGQKPSNGVLAPANSLQGAQQGNMPATGDPAAVTESQRNSLVDHGTIVNQALGPCVPQSLIAALSQAIAQQIMASGRFDGIPVSGASAMSADELAAAVEKLAEERAADVAKQREEARGSNYDFKWRGTIITGEAIKQVWNSIYAYEIVLGEPVITTANGQTTVSIPVQVNFYHIAYYGPDGTQLPAPQVQGVPGGGLSINVSATVPGNDPCPAIQQALQSIPNVTGAVQGIPAFQAHAYAIEVLDGGSILTMRLGANEGVKLGDQYDLYEVMQDGSKKVVGHAVVTKLGTGLVSAGPDGGVSKADVTENRTQLEITWTDPNFDTKGNLSGIRIEQHH